MTMAPILAGQGGQVTAIVQRLGNCRALRTDTLVGVLVCTETLYFRNRQAAQRRRLLMIRASNSSGFDSSGTEKRDGCSPVNQWPARWSAWDRCS